MTIGLTVTGAIADPRTSVKPVPADPSRGHGGSKGVLPTEKIDVAGRSRDYRLVVPKSLDPKIPSPLVFAYHGYGDTKESMAEYTQLDKLAEQHKFVLVYPEGRVDGQNHYWNVTPSAARHDVEFFDELYDHVTGAYNIDRNRVYLTGISNGAFFINLLASQRATRVAAIASHSGGIGPVGQKQPQLKKKYAVLIIHGDKDETIKLKTGQHARDVYREWEHPVDYLEIPGLDHAWGTKAGVNEKIWKFFEAHPLQ
jgi:poly(3-hydroxybutyrate) depolymerase